MRKIAMRSLILAGIFAALVGSVTSDSQQYSASDSYLGALSDSHGGSTETVKREGYYPDYAGYPDAIYNKPFPYPDVNYGPPKPIYGPPAYPQPQYGPPPANFGPPGFYGVPHAMLGLLDKLKFKLDLFTIGKIILKLVIFKKIVSLIAILCLLLFIPSLKHKVIEGHTEELRSYARSQNSVDEKIDNLATFVRDSIENFSNGQREDFENVRCNSIYCKIRGMLRYLHENLSYDKLVELYTKYL